MKRAGFIGTMVGMSVLLILDGDSKTGLSEELRASIAKLARERGLAFEEAELARDDVPPCIGCLHCVTKHAGKCIHHQALTGLIQKTLRRRFIIFLTPALFGTFSSTIKNVVDRGGLVLRDHRECVQIMIGYGEEATDEEAATFIDIPGWHLGKADIVHPTLKDHFEAFVTRSTADNDRICGALEGILT
jgi:multimeric flavodoxin WrbA